MNEIQRLIHEMCPNGVPVKPLWTLTAWDKKFNAVGKSMQKKIIKYPYLLAKDLFALQTKGGNVKLLSTGTQEGWTTEELAGQYLCEGEIVSIPWGKSEGAKNPIKYYKGKFVTADNRIATSLDTNVLNNKYLYYWLIRNSDAIDKLYRGASILHPEMNAVLNLQIPLPPLTIQQRIVEILDKFTSLVSSLDSEIALRQKQYEYYRNKLLSFEEGDEGVEWKSLGELCNNISSGKCTKKNEIGNYAVYGSTGIIAYSDGYTYDKDQILVARVGANAGYVHIAKGKYDVTDNTLILNLKEDSLLRYLYFILLKENLNQYAKGGGQPLVTGKELKELYFPIPPKSVQLSIVRTLDTFESLLTNLKKERELRQKQYEYYREELLTFA